MSAVETYPPGYWHRARRDGWPQLLALCSNCAEEMDLLEAMTFLDPAGPEESMDCHECGTYIGEEAPPL